MSTATPEPKASSPSPEQTESAAAPGAPPPKPLLRGVSHQIAFFVATAATIGLVASARTTEVRRAAAVFGICLSALFGVSALYHRVSWSERARLRMRRIDHAAIFLLIAGGYTPLFALVPSAPQMMGQMGQMTGPETTAGIFAGYGALVSIWIGAGIGVVKSVAWLSAPKWFTALLCVALGWTVIGEVVGRTAQVGAPAIGFLVASGLVYSLGAVVYATKRPDPWPRVFGYHEIFHLLVIFASVTLFTHVCLVIRAVGG